MKDAHAAHSDENWAGMMCLLVYLFHIPDDRVEDMPYLRSVFMVDWYGKFIAPSKMT